MAEGGSGGGETPLPDILFRREDERDDATFYAEPRLVQHIDPATVAALTAFYAERLRPGSRVLDLMSSWVSHLPESMRFAHVAGLGMNADELARNPRLDERVTHDLNADPRLPWPDARFDAVLIAVSVQYLTRPVAVFAEISRVLAAGGELIVAHSQRCFPTKAVRAFLALAPGERLRLVAEYLRRAGGFGAAEIHDRSPPDADPLWLVTASRRTSACSYEGGGT